MSLSHCLYLGCYCQKKVFILVLGFKSPFVNRAVATCPCVRVLSENEGLLSGKSKNIKNIPLTAELHLIASPDFPHFSQCRLCVCLIGVSISLV